MAPPSKAAKAAKAAAKAMLPTNLFAMLEGKDGNPSTPQEFDESFPAEGEVYFKPEEEADEPTKKKVFLLNFIHQGLHHNTARNIPALTGEDLEDRLEIYHRATYLGKDIDVCVYFEDRDSDGNKSCLALVKFSSDSVDDEAQIFAGASETAEAKADTMSSKVAQLRKSYWAPRWKYVVNILRGEMANRYSIHGVYSAPPELVKDEEVSDSNETIEEDVEVFAGCTGKIIGPAGAVINSIRKESGIKNIQMPEKTPEGQDRPKARSLVTIKVEGTARQIAKAKKLLLAINDDWANAPRGDRAPKADFHSSAGFHDGAAATSNDFHGSGDSGVGLETTTDGSADWEKTTGGGGDGEWAAPAAPAQDAGGETW